MALLSVSPPLPFGNGRVLDPLVRPEVAFVPVPLPDEPPSRCCLIEKIYSILLSRLIVPALSMNVGSSKYASEQLLNHNHFLNFKLQWSYEFDNPRREYIKGGLINSRIENIWDTLASLFSAEDVDEIEYYLKQMLLEKKDKDGFCLSQKLKKELSVSSLRELWGTIIKDNLSSFKKKELIIDNLLFLLFRMHGDRLFDIFDAGAKQFQIKLNENTSLDAFKIIHSSQILVPASKRKWMVCFTGNGNCYQHNLERYHQISENTGINILTVNYPGVGNSTGLPKSGADLVAAGITLVNTLGLNNIFLFGYSQGGAVAIQVAAACQKAGKKVHLCVDRTYSTFSNVVRALINNIFSSIAEMKFFKIMDGLGSVAPGLGILTTSLRFVVYLITELALWILSKIRWDFDNVTAYHSITGPKLVIQHKLDGLICSGGRLSEHVPSEPTKPGGRPPVLYYEGPFKEAGMAAHNVPFHEATLGVENMEHFYKMVEDFVDS